MFGTLYGMWTFFCIVNARHYLRKVALSSRLHAVIVINDASKKVGQLLIRAVL